MRRLVKAALIAALPATLGLAAASSAPAQTASGPTTILTGEWEYGYRLAGFLPAGKERKCLGPAEVKRFADGICTSRYRCEYDVKTVANGKVNLKGVWIDKKGRSAPVTAVGDYAPERFTLDIKLKTTGGIPISGVMNARRVAATCSGAAS